MKLFYYQVTDNDGDVMVVYRMTADGTTMERWDWKKKAWVEAYEGLATRLVGGDPMMEELKGEAAAKKAIKSRTQKVE